MLRNQGDELTEAIELTPFSREELIRGNDSGPPPIEAMLTRFDPDQIKYNKHFDNIFYIGYLKR